MSAAFDRLKELADRQGSEQPKRKRRARCISLNAAAVPTGKDVAEGYLRTLEQARAAGDMSVVNACVVELARMGVHVRQ